MKKNIETCTLRSAALLLLGCTALLGAGCGASPAADATAEESLTATSEQSLAPTRSAIIATCDVKTVTDGATCGFEEADQIVQDAVRCGEDLIANATKCGEDFLEDAERCGKSFVTDAARCGTEIIDNFTALLRGAVCLVTKKEDCAIPKVCEVANVCAVPRTCPVARTCTVRVSRAKACQVWTCGPAVGGPVLSPPRVAVPGSLAAGIKPFMPSDPTERERFAKDVAELVKALIPWYKQIEALAGGKWKVWALDPGLLLSAPLPRELAEALRRGGLPFGAEVELTREQAMKFDVDLWGALGSASVAASALGPLILQASPEVLAAALAQVEPARQLVAVLVDVGVSTSVANQITAAVVGGIAWHMTAISLQVSLRKAEIHNGVVMRHPTLVVGAAVYAGLGAAALIPPIVEPF